MFPRARVHWSRRRGSNQPFNARLCIATALRWVLVDSDDSTTKLDIYSFRGQYCISLERLKESAVWQDVEQALVPFDNGRDRGFTVVGKLTHPGTWSAGRRDVKLALFLILLMRETQ